MLHTRIFALTATVLVVASAFILVPYGAQAALFAPGATLDPNCLPTDANCGIVGVAGLADVSPGYGIAAWGDSLTAGITTGGATSLGVGSSYPSQLAALTGYYTYNGGIPGENSNTLLTLMQNDTRRQHMPAVIWIGYNDIHSAGLTNTQIETNIASMVSLVGSSNYIILGVINNNTGSSDWVGGANYNTITALNADLASIYGSHYIDIRAYLVSQFNPSLPQDVTDASNDTVPTSLRAADNVHLNSAGYLAVATKINTKINILTSGVTPPKSATALNLSYLFSSPGIIGENNPNVGYFTTLNASTSIAVGGVPLLKIGGSNSSDLILGKGADTNLFTSSAVHNIAIGQSVLSVATSSSFNTGIGSLALQSDTSGASNVAVGYNALNANTTGGSNVGVGHSALLANTTGSFNTAVGDWALWFDSAATNTTAVGYRAGYGGSAYSNLGGVYLGYFSGRALQTGSDYNTFLGYQSGNEVSTGNGNILIGPEVITGGNHLTTGQGNIGIGYNILFPGGTSAANQLNIGNFIFGTGITSTSSSNTVIPTPTGNLGIGTSTPNAELEISTSTANTVLSAGGPMVAITNRSTTNNNFEGLSFRTQDLNGSATTSARIAGINTLHTAGAISGALAFFTNNAGNQIEVSRFTPAGNFGVGTTSPYGNVTIQNNYGSANTTLFAIGSSTSANGSTANTLFSVANTGNVTVTGSAATCVLGNSTGSVTCTSDARLKTNITKIPNALAGIEQINGVTFNWSDPAKSQATYIGVIAQDVQKVFPQAVVTLDSGYFAVDYGALVAPLIEAVKELAADFTSHFPDKNTLCLGSTCVTEGQLKTILQSSGQTANPPPVAGGGGADLSSDNATSTATSTDNSTTTDTTQATTSSSDTTATTTGSSNQ